MIDFLIAAALPLEAVQTRPWQFFIDALRLLRAITRPRWVVDHISALTEIDCGTTMTDDCWDIMVARRRAADCVRDATLARVETKGFDRGAEGEKLRQSRSIIDHDFIIRFDSVRTLQNRF